jgi:hypothetical protein
MDGAICRIRGIVLAVISMALLSGCPIHTKRVLIIGDSITLMSAGEITRAGNEVVDTDPNNRMSFTILANIGIGARRTLGEPSDPEEYWSGLMSNSIQPGNFDAVVVALATNDCHLLSAQDDYSADIARIVSAISAADPDVPIFWLTVPDYPELPDCASIVNAGLEQFIQAGTYPNLKSFDYNAWAGANPECFNDGVHLRERWRKDPHSGGSGLTAPPDYCVGQFKYAMWLKEQLDVFFGPRA